MFSSLSNLASLLKNAPEMIRQAQQMQGKMAELQEKLAKLRVEGQAGGGMVTVTASGQNRIVGVAIDPSAFSGDDREMLEDLIKSAANQALDKARTAASEEMSRLMGGVGEMPGMADLLAKAGLGPGGFGPGGFGPGAGGAAGGTET